MRNMKTFLGIAAIRAWLFGAALLFAPGPFYQPAKIALTPMLATLAQAHGATYTALGCQSRVLVAINRAINTVGLARDMQHCIRIAGISIQYLDGFASRQNQ